MLFSNEFLSIAAVSGASSFSLVASITAVSPVVPSFLQQGSGSFLFLTNSEILTSFLTETFRCFLSAHFLDYHQNFSLDKKFQP